MKRFDLILMLNSCVLHVYQSLRHRKQNLLFQCFFFLLEELFTWLGRKSKKISFLNVVIIVIVNVVKALNAP